MGDRSGIEWTDATWNPVTGCSHVSEGCRHCYAETLSLRMGWSQKPWTAQNVRENVVLHPDRLDQPLRWTKPRRVFVNSMSDLFHERIPLQYIASVFAVMAAAYQHTFQVLTKRPERMRQLLSREDFWTVATMQGVERWWGRRELATADLGVSAPLSNVWLGVSAEDQRTADERIPILLDTPATVRFLSLEPLLGPVQFPLPCSGSVFWTGIHWVIVGGESGLHYRLMDPPWVQSLRDQCVAAGVPFFFKQWGGRTPKVHGRQLDGRTWDEMPSVVLA